VTPVAAPRVAFFSDCFWETNGVALTARMFQDFAARHHLPFFSFHTGPETVVRQQDTVTIFEAALSKASFGLDVDLHFDMLAGRHLPQLRKALQAFRPDLIHITGPGHAGILGAWLAHSLKVPLTASWHTNVHEFGARRLEKLLAFTGERASTAIANAAERAILAATLRFYQIGRTLFAPNPDLVRMLRDRVGKPTYEMRRGVDTILYDPAKRRRSDRTFLMGYVGRITPEKNVRFLAKIEQALLEANAPPFRFIIIGQGSEKEWLRANLKHAEFPGVLKGEALAQAYANLDLFVFPSKTDTFGNVVQEALASGVPAVVTSEGGPKYIVRSGESGFIAADDASFVRCILDVMRDPSLLANLRRQSRAQACDTTWDRVFERVYEAYRDNIRPALHVHPAAHPAAR
jgi:phosphatidylinositol alpha 1,6-mannosyltransferase